MGLTVRCNKNGFTLIEVMIAMFVLLIGMLALLNTAAVVIDNNLANILRDESSSVAESSMNTLKNTPFPSLAVGTSGPTVVTRLFKGIAVNYSVSTTIAQPDIANPDTLTLQVKVTWTYKGNTYTHSISSVANNLI